MGQKMKRRKELARPGIEGDALENALRNPHRFWGRKQTREEKESPKSLKNIPFTFEFVSISAKNTFEFVSKKHEITFEFVSISGKNTFEFVRTAKKKSDEIYIFQRIL